MGLFSKEACSLCGIEITNFRGFKLTDGSILCRTCSSKLKLNAGFDSGTLRLSNIDGINEIAVKVDKDLQDNYNRINNFIPTTKIGSYVWFDDNNKWFACPKGAFSKSIDNSYIFSYDEIIDFELLEDGSSMTKGGLGKALVGGAFFGLAGVIVGGTSKKTQQTCTKLEFKITTRNFGRPVVYVELINMETKRKGFIYKQAFKLAQEMISKFQIIVDELERENKTSGSGGDTDSNSVSIADEIKKFKELLDLEVITQDEFNKMKLTLLNKGSIY